MKKILFSLCVTLAFIIQSMSIAQADDIDKAVKNFKKLISENMAGQPFRKHDYLARDGMVGKYKLYVGAVSNIDSIRLRVDRNNKIYECVIMINKDIRRHLLPVMEKHFGEYYKKDDNSIVNLNASLIGKKLNAHTNNYNNYKYNKNGIGGGIEANGLIKTASGEIYSQPKTIYYAIVE